MILNICYFSIMSKLNYLFNAKKSPLLRQNASEMGGGEKLCWKPFQIYSGLCVRLFSKLDHLMQHTVMDHVTFFICWGATIAQWIRLRLPSCSPWFESQACHLSFYKIVSILPISISLTTFSLFVITFVYLHHFNYLLITRSNWSLINSILCLYLHLINRFQMKNKSFIIKVGMDSCLLKWVDGTSNPVRGPSARASSAWCRPSSRASTCSPCG